MWPNAYVSRHALTFAGRRLPVGRHASTFGYIRVGPHATWACDVGLFHKHGPDVSVGMRCANRRTKTRAQLSRRATVGVFMLGSIYDVRRVRRARWARHHVGTGRCGNCAASLTGPRTHGRNNRVGRSRACQRPDRAGASMMRATWGHRLYVNTRNVDVGRRLNAGGSSMRYALTTFSGMHVANVRGVRSDRYHVSCALILQVRRSRVSRDFPNRYARRGSVIDHATSI